MLTLTLKSGKKITVDATRTNKPAPWHPSGHSYRVAVKYNGKSFSFDFWDSAHNAQTGKPCDLRGAVASWASDVFAGMNAQDGTDIMNEFGYTDPREARRVFKGVKHAEEQARTIGISEADLSELADY